MKKIYLLFITFFFVYSIKFNFIPIYTGRLVIVILVIWAIINIKKLSYIRYDFFPIILLYTLLLIYSFFINFENSFSDSYLLNGFLLLGFESILGSLLLALVIVKERLNFQNFSSLILSIVFIQSIFIIFYFINPSFKLWVSENIPLISNYQYDHQIFGSRGLTHSPGATLSLVQSLGLLLVAFLVSKENLFTRKYILLKFSFILILFSIFLTGRTGLLIIPFIIFYFIISNKALRYIKKRTIGFFVITPVLLTLSIYYVLYFAEFIDGGTSMVWGEGVVERVARWVVSAFVDDYGSFGSSTLKILSDHWFFPNDTNSFIFGDFSTWYTNRIPSDIGYIRILHGFGLIGFIIYYMIYVMAYLAAVFSTNNYKIICFITSLYIFLFLVEYKEPFLIKLFVNKIVFIISFYLILNKASYNKVLKYL